jgi:hypothetical protein
VFSGNGPILAGEGKKLGKSDFGFNATSIDLDQYAFEQHACRLPLVGAEALAVGERHR